MSGSIRVSWSAVSGREASVISRPEGSVTPIPRAAIERPSHEMGRPPHSARLNQFPGQIARIERDAFRSRNSGGVRKNPEP